MGRGTKIKCAWCRQLQPRTGSVIILRSRVCAICKCRPRKPFRALDLFCGGGGAAIGLLSAGFDEIVGVDVADHSRVYPGTFIQGDALNLELNLSEFDLIWASPPCQAYSVARRNKKAGPAAELIEETRTLLSGHDYTVIENVLPAPIRRDLVLSGPMFGLDRIERRRAFELSFYCWQPMSPRIVRSEPPLPITKNLSWGVDEYNRWKERVPSMKWRIPVKLARRAMGIRRQFTAHEIGEAVPPAYAEYIGREAIEQMLKDDFRG